MEIFLSGMPARLGSPPRQKHSGANHRDQVPTIVIRLTQCDTRLYMAEGGRDDLGVLRTADFRWRNLPALLGGLVQSPRSDLHVSTEPPPVSGGPPTKAGCHMRWWSPGRALGHLSITGANYRSQSQKVRAKRDSAHQEKRKNVIQRIRRHTDLRCVQ
jgi:hypothetical protein